MEDNYKLLDPTIKYANSFDLLQHYRHKDNRIKAQM